YLCGRRCYESALFLGGSGTGRASSLGVLGKRAESRNRRGPGIGGHGAGAARPAVVLVRSIWVEPSSAWHAKFRRRHGATREQGRRKVLSFPVLGWPLARRHCCEYAART